MEKINEVVSQRLKVLREKTGISQSEASRRLGVTKSTLSLYETGKCLPHAGTIRTMSEMYDVSADYILGLSDFPVKAKAYCEDYARDLLFTIEQISSLVKPFVEE